MLTWAAVLAMALGGCGDDDSTGAATTAVASATAGAVKTPDADGAITIVALNLAFDTEELKAPAGTLTIRLENEDGGTPHNVHFFAGTNADGESVGETAIENGRSTGTVEIDLTSGTYYFQCDVHPNMHGVLTVDA